MKNAILGAGQVANAIADNLLNDYQMFDIGSYEGKEMAADLLHVCIPFIDAGQFITSVEVAIKSFSPKIVIIHSTVKPGTSKQIKHPAVFYSPVNGRHGDDFSSNVKLYFKVFAGPEAMFDEIEPEFGFACHYWSDNTEELEFAKVMCTSYMYWNLVYEKEIARVCKERGYDLTKVYKDWNFNYNRGISVLHPEWQRPVYNHDDNPVPGGHCLEPNIWLDGDNLILELLQDWTHFNGNFKYSKMEKRK